MNVMTTILVSITIATIIYVLLVGYDGLIKLTMSLFRLAGYADTLHYSPQKRQLSADSSMPISLILPDCDKDAQIVKTIEDLLTLDYPDYEIIAICNSERSDALDKLIDAYSMTDVCQPIKRSVAMHKVRKVYRTAKHLNLIVLDKEGMARYDALNAGVNTARYPIFAVLGAGYQLEKDALTQVAVSFSRSHRVAAVGSLPRIHKKGRQLNLFDSLQEADYLRTFPTGLTVPGQKRLSVIPGAFGAFRKQTVIEDGGFAPSGSETEMVLRISGRYIKRRRKIEVDLLPNPVFVTNPPYNVKTLAKQRMEWQADMIFSLWNNKRMLFNPAYGRAGLFDTPYYWLFNIVGPLLELIGLFVIPLSFAFGIISLNLLMIFLAAELLLGSIVSLSAVVAQEILDSDVASPERTARRTFCAIINNFGFRQFTLLFYAAGYFKPRDKKA